ncbi:MAG: AAA family ATPase [bacterium]|nr:AAA family ATPase [bacterium]
MGWARNGHLAALESAASQLSEGACELAMLPVDDARDLSVDPSHDFANFIVGPSNQESLRRAEDFAPGAGKKPGLLFIQGPSGSGKSHLLHALGHRFRETHGNAAVLLGNAEELSLELINAIWNNELAGFRAVLHGARALLIDDAQALAGKEATQEEIVHAIDALAEAGVPVVVASTRAPSRIAGLIEPLLQRLEAGQHLQLNAPEWETRVAIVLDRIQRWQVDASAPVASFLAGKLRSNLSRLDTLLTSLMTHSSCAQSLADLNAVKHALNEAGNRAIRVSPEDVFSVVCRHFSVKMRDLRSPSRSPRVTTPRQIAMYLIRRYCGHSYPEIGRRFARHHTTALHSDRLVRRHLDQNGSLRAAVVLLEKELLRLSEDGG